MNDGQRPATVRKAGPGSGRASAWSSAATASGGSGGSSTGGGPDLIGRSLSPIGVRLIGSLIAYLAQHIPDRSSISRPIQVCSTIDGLPSLGPARRGDSALCIRPVEPDRGLVADQNGTPVPAIPHPCV